MLTATATGNTPPASSANAQISEGVRLIPLEEVMARCGMGRTAIYARIKAATFPAPAKVGSSSRWVSTEVDRWVLEVIAARPRAKAA
jgi:prophage regulatory protein